ncbi:MAG TPA: nitroreductase family protein, partial [Ktedonobacterales bacterium]
MKLDLTLDEVLSTTRSIRRRLDIQRPVEPEILRECLELAIQAPTGSNNQNWHFILVTDPRQRQALGEIYRKGFATYCALAQAGQAVAMRKTAVPDREAISRLRHSSQYLLEHMHEVP